MPTELFCRLDQVKRDRIVNSGISEFAYYDYGNSSTNRIVSRCSISKGSLFQYFKNKEEFYFYLLDQTTQELQNYIKDRMSSFPTNLLERVVLYSKLEFSWYINHPEKYRFIMNAFTRNDTEIYKKTETRYRLMGEDIFNQYVADIDTTPYNCEKETIVSMLKWILEGFNRDFMERIKSRQQSDLEEICEEYVTSLMKYLQVLKTGMYGS